MLVGFCFDFYRIVRWRLGFNRGLTFVGDILFSVIAFAVIFISAQKANYLEFRFYLFGASLLGLLFYLKFFSFFTKKVFQGILSFIAAIKNGLFFIIRIIIHSFFRLLTILMSVPYGILRWFALLLFRMGQALGKESKLRIKKRIDQNPKE